MMTQLVFGIVNINCRCSTHSIFVYYYCLGIKICQWRVLFFKITSVLSALMGPTQTLFFLFNWLGHWTWPVPIHWCWHTDVEMLTFLEHLCMFLSCLDFCFCPMICYDFNLNYCWTWRQISRWSCLRDVVRLVRVAAYVFISSNPIHKLTSVV